MTISTSTETNSTCLRSRQCGFGSFRDQLSFALRDQGQNSHGEPIHVGTVAADEVDSGVLETKQELSVPAQTVQFCDHQSSFGPFALFESGVELGTIVETTAFDLREFVKDLTFLAEDESGDGIPLGVHTVTVVPLVSR